MSPTQDLVSSTTMSSLYYDYTTHAVISATANVTFNMSKPGVTLLPAVTTATASSDAIWRAINISIGCVGLIGNVFVIVVIMGFTSLYKQLATVFVINQSVIDAASSLFVIAQQTTNYFKIPVYAGQPASEVYCRVWRAQTIMWGLYVSSTYNLVALTIERYFKIVYPVVYKSSFTIRKAKVMLISVWLFGFAFEAALNIPTWVISNGTCWIMTTFPTDALKSAVAYITITVEYWLPLAIFVAAYSRMIRSLRRVGPHQGNRNDSIARAQRNLTKTVIMASAGFVVCWSWNLWYYFAVNIGAPLTFTDSFYRFSVVMVSAHCSINPFIYIANYDQFRNAVRRIVTASRQSHTDLDMYATEDKESQATNAKVNAETVVSHAGRFKAQRQSKNDENDVK